MDNKKTAQTEQTQKGAEGSSFMCSDSYVAFKTNLVKNNIFRLIESLNLRLDPQGDNEDYPLTKEAHDAYTHDLNILKKLCPSNIEILEMMCKDDVKKPCGCACSKGKQIICCAQHNEISA